MTIERLTPGSDLQAYPPAERWDDWPEYDVKQWPRRVEKRYMLVPTICFNCEAACGLLAYVDKQTMRVRKFEGNPLHPASRGRNCAKGPATINQINDPERILYPLRRAGGRGEGKWRRVSWDEVLDEIGGRIRKAFLEGRRNEVMYHVGRPGHERVMDRILKAWRIDGHNSHTNVCSASARLGYALWSGYDRPSPDHANARFILLLSSHLEAGHYFNPHAQRIIDGKLAGAKLAVMDPRLSNTASDGGLLAAHLPGQRGRGPPGHGAGHPRRGPGRPRVRRGVDELAPVHGRRASRGGADLRFFPGGPEAALSGLHPGLRRGGERRPAGQDRRSGAAHRPRARRLRLARLARHGQRQPGRLAGRARAAAFDRAHGQHGTRGGTSPHGWNKYKPVFWEEPPGQKEWNELLFPKEWPLSHYEMSFLLPHFLEGGPGQARRLLHARLQPRLDQPRRPHLDGGPARRVARRAARGP
jgi:hypothetical protein